MMFYEQLCESHIKPSVPEKRGSGSGAFFCKFCEICKITFFSPTFRSGIFLKKKNIFLAIFIAFEWGRIFESAKDKWEVKCSPKLSQNYFSVNDSVFAVVFRLQISTNQQFYLKL